MAKENVHELRAQNNGQTSQEAIRRAADELAGLADRVEALSFVNLHHLSEPAETGFARLLADLADDLRTIEGRLSAVAK